MIKIISVCKDLYNFFVIYSVRWTQNKIQSQKYLKIDNYEIKKLLEKFNKLMQIMLSKMSN